MNGYNIYLMISLAQSVGVMSKELEYDLAWAEGQILYKEFDDTVYSLQEKSEQDSILDFLKNFEKTDSKKAEVPVTKIFHITKSRFVEWYYESGQDSENEKLVLDLAIKAIVQLSNKGRAEITVEEIFNDCNHDSIRLSYLEEFDLDDDRELSELKVLYEVKLIEASEKQKQIVKPIAEFKAVFNPLTKQLAVLYGNHNMLYTFDEFDEWVALSFNNDENHPNYLHIHLDYDETFQLCIYPKVGVSESYNEDLGVYFNSSKMNEIPKEIKIVYTDADWNKQFKDYLDSKNHDSTVIN